MRDGFGEKLLRYLGSLAAAAAFVVVIAPPSIAAPARPAKPPVLTLADLGPLTLPPPAPIAATPAQAAALAAPLGLEPAPMPNPDIDGPGHIAPSNLASLNPAFISRKLPSASDGFARASSANEANDARDNPAAGLNLSVPVKQ